MMKIMHRICPKTAPLLLLGLLASCDRPAPPPPAAPQDPPATAPATRPSTDAWTTERVVEDPAGYRQWWEKQTATRAEEYRRRLAEVQAKQAAFERSWETLTQNLLLAQSIASQVTRAQSLVKANPNQKSIVVGGRTINLDRIPELQRRLDTYVRETQNLADQARKAADAYAARNTVLDMQIERIDRLRQRAMVEIDLVRQGGSAIGVDFRSVEQQLEDLSLSNSADRIAASTANDLPLPATLPTTRPIAVISVQELLDL